METPATLRVLGEPALLYLIFRQLSQRDLLCIQRVCRTWHSVISTDSRLLAIMWLHPGSPTTDIDGSKTQLNPLLLEAFPTMFRSLIFADGFTTLEPRDLTPFWDALSYKFDQQWHEILTYPNATWRRMIPCLPAPDELLVNVCYGEHSRLICNGSKMVDMVAGEKRAGEEGAGEEGAGKLMRLKFSNRGTQHTRRSHPPWLTFDLIYDIVECAWYQASPWRLHLAEIVFPSASTGPDQHHHRFVYRDANISDELRASAESGVRRMRLKLEPDFRSEAERKRQRYAAIAREKRSLRYHVQCSGPFLRRMILFTDEFHFADALSLYEIEWDEVHEYKMPPRLETFTRQPPPQRCVVS